VLVSTLGLLLGLGAVVVVAAAAPAHNQQVSVEPTPAPTGVAPGAPATARPVAPVIPVAPAATARPASPSPPTPAQVRAAVDAAIAKVRSAWQATVSCDSAGVVYLQPEAVVGCRYTTANGVSGTFTITFHRDGTYTWSAGVPNQAYGSAPVPPPNGAAPPPQANPPAPPSLCGNEYLSISSRPGLVKITVDNRWFGGSSIVVQPINPGSHMVVRTFVKTDGEYHPIGYSDSTEYVNVPRCGGYRAN